MRKVYKVSVDCANCANKIEAAVKTISGVNSAVLNFITQKLIVDLDDPTGEAAVVEEIKLKGKKIERDFELEG